MYGALRGMVRYSPKLFETSQIFEIRVNEVVHVDYSNLLDLSFSIEPLKLLFIVRIAEVGLKA